MVRGNRRISDVESVKGDGKFYIVYDDGDSQDDVLDCSLQLLVDLARGTKSEVPRKKHVSEKVKMATTNKLSPSGIKVEETPKHEAPCMYAYDVRGRGLLTRMCGGRGNGRL